MKKGLVLLALVVVLSAVPLFTYTSINDNFAQKTQEAQETSEVTTSVILTEQNNDEQSNSYHAYEETQTPSKTTHTEYIKTYYVYALEGAVVTWFDPQTGEFRYKDKCEACGQIVSGEHSGGLRIAEGGSYNAGFSCSNSNCSMWGQPQRAIIGCSADGVWTDEED